MRRSSSGSNGTSTLSASARRIQLDVGDVPLTAEEQFEEKVSGWSRRSSFRGLASSILTGRELEKTASKDSIALKEAEDVLFNLRSYMNTTAKAVNEADITPSKGRGMTRISVSAPSSTMADCIRLKNSTRGRSTQAAIGAETTTAVPTAAAAAPTTDTAALAFKARDEPFLEEVMRLNSGGGAEPPRPARPRSAPGLRRSLEMTDGASLLDTVRRHNASRFSKWKTDVDPVVTANASNIINFAELHPAPSRVSNEEPGSTKVESLQRLESRTQEERFGGFAHTRKQHDIIDAAAKGDKGLAIANSNKSKPINIVEFDKKQQSWLESVQIKREAVKREVESNEAKEFRVVPDIKLTAESWERAKREHAIKAEHQARLEEERLEGKILKEEMRNQRLEIALAKSKLKKPQPAIVGAVDVSKTKVRRRPKAKLLKSQDQEEDAYMYPGQTGRHDPDNFCLPFEIDGDERGEHEKAPRFTTPRSAMLSHLSQPKIDSLDLLGLGGVHAQEIYSGRRVLTARDAVSKSGSSNAENKSKRVPPQQQQRRQRHQQQQQQQQQQDHEPLGAMASLGSSQILDKSSSGNFGSQSDHEWLEGILRQRKEAERAREEEFEKEVAVAISKARLDERAVTKSKTSFSAPARGPARGPIFAPAPAAPTSIASLEDNLYISDSDEEGEAPHRKSPPPPSRPLPVQSDTSAPKLTATAAAAPPIHSSAPSRTAVQAIETAAPAKSSKCVTSPKTQSPTRQAKPISLEIPNCTASHQSSQPLQLDIPASGFLLANMDRSSPRKVAPPDETKPSAPSFAPSSFSSSTALRSPRRPSTTSLALSAAMHDYSAVVRDMTLQNKSDPQTEILLSRAALPGDAPARPQRPYNSHLLTAAQRENELSSSKRREEQAMTRFFDSSSTADKGRFRLHDARNFVVDSMHRKPDILNESVTLLCGTRKDTGQQQVITVLFDRAEFSETKAREWWHQHRDRLIV